MSNKTQGPQFVLCIDWETSGSNFGGDSTRDYQGISCGVIVARADDFSPVERLYMEIKFDAGRYKWSAEAERIHGLSRDYLDQHGVDSETAAVQLAELILKYWGPTSRVMLLGHNVEFDRRFTNQLLNNIDIEFSVESSGQYASRIELHHVMLDTSSAGFIGLGIYKSDALFKKMGFQDRGEHNALTDAEQTLETAAVLRALVLANFEEAVN